MRQVFKAALAASFAAAAFAASAAQGVQDTSVTFVQVADTSGSRSALTLELNAGTLAYFKEVNARGGIHGRQLKLETIDDGYAVQRTKEATQAAIAQDRAFAFVSSIGTANAEAVLPLINAASVPLVAPLSGAETLRERASRYVFHVRASYYDETAAIVKQLLTLGLKKVAVFRQNDSYGQAGLDGVVRALKAHQLEPIAVGLVERNTVDVAAAVQAIVPKNPDAIVQISAYKSCAAFVRAARKAGFGGTFYNVSFVGTQALADELGPDARGVAVSQVMPFPFQPKSPIAREFLNAIQKAGGEYKANYSSIEGYVAAKVFTEGLRRAGKALTRESLVTALESMREHNMGGFTVSYAPKSHEGSRFTDLTIIGRGGKFMR